MSFIERLLADFPAVLTINEVATALHLPVNDIEAAISMGQLSPTHSGQTLVFDRRELSQQIEALHNGAVPLQRIKIV